MSIESICAGCGRLLAVADRYAGQRARCPACGQVYRVPIPRDPDVVPTASDPRSPPPAEPTSEPTDSMYWMRTTDGTLYGPAERSVLERWFREGRVGRNYRIRIGSDGDWRPAAQFVPVDPVASLSGRSADPPHRSAPHGSSATGPTKTGSTYPKPDPSRLVATMAILGWITLLVGCPICVGFAIAAVLLGRTALGDIDAGIAEPRNRGLVEAGYWMGLALLILAGLILVCLIAALVSMVAPGSFWF